MQFLLNLPTCINFGKKSSDSATTLVNRLIRSGEIKYILAVKRGERNLILLYLIDKNGKKILERSLNVIDGINYRAKILELENLRQRNRRELDPIAKIKDLKKGYLSAAIGEIIKLMREYPCVLAIEEINPKTKSKASLDSTVYQDFELALCTKLSYLVSKDIDPQEPGGVFHGLQMTSTQDKGKHQNGILFTLSTNSTENLDPTTGFRSPFFFTYTNINDARKTLKSFDIRYDKEKEYFTFDFDLKNFLVAKSLPEKTKWTACSYGMRSYKISREESPSYVEIDITDKFINLLAHYNVSLDDNLNEAIQKVDDAKFYQSFIQTMKLLFQSTNIVNNGNNDYMISPILNRNGRCFDTRRQIPDYPLSSESNTAFNLARKCLMLLERIEASDETDKIDYFIEAVDWHNYASQNTI